MNRSARRHRSTKVPNVKLRPAPSAGSNRHDQRHYDEEEDEEAMRHYRALRAAHATGKQKEDGEVINLESDDDEEGEGKDADDYAPLAGCVICTTGFEEEKVSLHECAIALGAKVEGNLTDAATHLIAREPGSDKYHWAVKIGVPIMRPEWLTDLRTLWQKAEPIPYDDLIDERRLHTFEGLSMAMAGVTDVETRREVRAKFKAGSGQTPITFKLDGSFTHLVCDDVTGSQTLQAVQKYLKKAGRYHRRGEDIPSNAPEAEMMLAAEKLKLVWAEWVEDSIAVQGCMEERLYSINEPRLNGAQRRKLVAGIRAKQAEKAKKTRASMESAREALRDPIQAAQAAEAKSGNRIGKALKQNMPRPTTKRPNMAIEQLMEQIGHSKVDNRESTPVAEKIVIKESAPPASVAKPAKTSPARVSEPDKPQPQGDFRQQVKASQAESDDLDLLVDVEASGLAISNNEKSLSELTFRIDLRDETKNGRVCSALRAYGVSQLLERKNPARADFYVKPLAKIDDDEDDGGDGPAKKDLGVPVTHFFIERCLMEDRVIGLHESFALQPSRSPFPLAGAENIIVALTGLGCDGDGPDRHQMEMALQACGIRYGATFKRGYHTHLLVGRSAEGTSSSTAKADRAKKWGVPIVGVEFVDRLYREGVISPLPVASMIRVSDRSPEKDESAIGDTSTASVSATVFHETQTMDQSIVAPSVAVKKEESAKEHVFQQPRSWHRAQSDSQQAVESLAKRETAETRPHHRIVDSEPPQPPHGPLSEVKQQQQQQQRMVPEVPHTLETGAQTTSTSADHVMRLLHNRAVPAATTGTSTNGSPASTIVGSGRKTRRMPPSMRDRIRERSNTPLRDDPRGDVTVENVAAAEELLAKGRQDEAIALMHAGGQSIQSLNPFALGGIASQFPGAAAEEKESSMRVVYDDPVARRERRKIAAMIGKAQSDREKQSDSSDADVSGPQSDSSKSRHIEPRSASNSPLKRVRTAMPGYSTSIKARRQSGTANRDA